MSRSKNNKTINYINFYKLAKDREKSPQNYLEFESYQAKFVINSLEEKGIDFNSLKLLDVGSGCGGYANEFAKRGAKVTALDKTNEFWQEINNVNFILGDAGRMPFEDKSFDFIFCSSMIEHIKEQETLITELSRVLKNGGLCYLSFPPFWSPVGAHQFKPFHYFGETIAVKLARKFNNSHASRYNDSDGVLYITTIRSIKKLIKKSDLKVKNVSTRFMPINFAKVPILNEILTWHVEFLLEKR